MIKKKILLMSMLPIFVFGFVFAGSVGSAEAAWWPFGRGNNTQNQNQNQIQPQQGRLPMTGRPPMMATSTGATSTPRMIGGGVPKKGDSFPSSLSSDAIACMKTAVEARETSIISATSAFHSSVAAALDARKTALLAAWSLSDATEIKTAIKSAGDGFGSSHKTASKTFESAKKTAMTTFKSSQKSCGVSGDADAGSISSSSSSLSAI